MHFVPEHFISSSVTHSDVMRSFPGDVGGRAMEEDGLPSSSSVGVAHEGSHVVDASTALSTLDTSTTTRYIHSGGLDHPGEGHGSSEVVAEVMATEGLGAGSLHGGGSEGGHRYTVEARSPNEFLRGYRAAVRHRGTPEEASGPASSSVGAGDSAASEAFRRRSRTPVAGSSRRSTSAEVRVDRAGHTPPRGRGPRGYSGSDQDEGEADSGELEGEDGDGREEGEGEVEADLR